MNYDDIPPGRIKELAQRHASHHCAWRGKDRETLEAQLYLMQLELAYASGYMQRQEDEKVIPITRAKGEGTHG